MFGIDPDTLKNLANLQSQISLFMQATTATLQRIELQLALIEAAQKETENGR